MPFKSKAQRRKFAELLVKGEITDEVYERWNRETGRTELPERAKKRATKVKRRVAKKVKRSGAKKVKRSGAKKTKRATSTRKRTKRGSTKRR
jgi:hypothetical protein